MHRFSVAAAALIAAGILLGGSLPAQQASPQKSRQSSSGTTQPANGTKAGADTATSPTPAAPSASPLSTDKDKESYAIGMNIAATLHQQSVDVDPKIVAQGLADALAGGKTLLSDDEAKTVLAQLQQKMQAAQEQKIQAVSDANKKDGDAYIAANRTKEGVVTLPSGLQYKILRQGTGPKPAATDTVICNYQGALIDGKVFDSSYERGQPVTIPVDRVIKGWTEALQLMPVGSKWQLVIPPDLAYGMRGAGQDIGPQATLVFDVELLSITQAPQRDSPQPDSNVPSAPIQIRIKIPNPRLP